MPVIACSFNTGWTCRHLLEEGPAVPVTLPHDAALAEPRTETAPGGTNTGWYEGYDYLYEKRFTPDAALQGQTLVLEFEGVYHNAEVWLNGEKLAFNPYGYTDFKVDLTGKLDFDAENVLQVIARNADQPNSRWYSGAGIYRPVTLWVGPEAHLLLDGLRVRTVSIDPPEVEVTAAASAPGTVQLQVLDGTTVLASASAEAGKPVRLKLPEAALWSPEHPQLYTLLTADEQKAKAIFAIGRGGAKPRKDIAIWSEVKDYVAFFYEELFTAASEYPENVSTQDALDILTRYRSLYSPADDGETWFNKVRELGESLGFAAKPKDYKKNPDQYKGHVGDVSQVIRLAITGRTNSPDLCSVMQILGEEVCQQRLAQAIELLSNR